MDDHRPTDASPPPLKIIDPIALVNVPVPPRIWLVPDWIPWRTTTALYGDGGTGKSLLALMLATCAATGLPWIGLEVTRCRVIYISCEDDGEELHRRQADINAALGLDFGDLENMCWVDRVGSENLLMMFEGAEGERTPFWGQIVVKAREFGAQLIIVDTVADTFGGNENVRPQVRQFVQEACTRLARLIDGVVVLCAHPSVTGVNSGQGSSGSTAWSNSVRSRLYLTRPAKEHGASEAVANDPRRFLTKMKANYSGSGDAIELEWRDGVFLPVNGRVTTTVEQIALRNRERAVETAFMSGLMARNSEGRPVSHSSHAKSYAPKALQNRPETKGYSVRDLEAAMERLFRAGKIQAHLPLGKNAERQKVYGVAPTTPKEAQDAAMESPDP